VLAIIAVAQATLFAVIGIWQALTHELLFFARTWKWRTPTRPSSG
jgi:hypothetical protein